MTREAVRANVNFNSVLLLIITGLSGWTLKTVFDMAVSSSADHASIVQHDRSITQLDARVSNLEYFRPRHDAVTSVPRLP